MNGNLAIGLLSEFSLCVWYIYGTDVVVCKLGDSRGVVVLWALGITVLLSVWLHTTPEYCSFFTLAGLKYCIFKNLSCIGFSSFGTFFDY